MPVQHLLIGAQLSDPCSAICRHITTNVDHAMQVKDPRDAFLASSLVRPPAMVTKKWPILVMVTILESLHQLQHLLLLH